MTVIGHEGPRAAGVAPGDGDGIVVAAARDDDIGSGYDRSIIAVAR